MTMTTTLGAVRRVIREALVSPKAIDGRDAPPNDNDVDLSLGDTAPERAANEVVGMLPPEWEGDVVVDEYGTHLRIAIGIPALRDEIDPSVVDVWLKAKRASSRDERSFSARYDAAYDSGKRAQIKAVSERPARVKDSWTAAHDTWDQIPAAIADVVHGIMVDELGYTVSTGHGLQQAFFTRGKIEATFWPASRYDTVYGKEHVNIRALFGVT